MVAAQGLLALVKAAAPKVAKLAGPEFVKWLAKTKNREALIEALKKSTSRLPAERLRSRIETTILVLQSIEESSSEPDRTQSTEQALARARRLLIKLDLPLPNRAERRTNVRAVALSLARLQQDLQSQLDDPEKADDSL